MAPWVPVRASEVRAVCGLDAERLVDADATLGVPWALVRHGRLCHTFATDDEAPSEAFSTTKTLAALVAGRVAFETRAIPRSGRKTGPFGDEDRVDHWLDHSDFAPDARVAHVLAMVAGGESVAYGERAMVYDTFGRIQLRSLRDALNAAIAQDPERLGPDLRAFTERFVFEPLGMTSSRWRAHNLAYTWQSTALDMARIGLFLLHGGVWNGERLVDAEWIRRMTHPAFEDANTGYGYLTWLSAASNHTYGGVGTDELLQEPPECMPVSVYGTYPHGLSESPDCHYDAPHTCELEYDDGVFQAIGFNGHVIQVHPGLDLVLVVRHLTPHGSGREAAAKLWAAVRPAIVAADPFYRGDETAFCDAYGRNAYAPFLR